MTTKKVDGNEDASFELLRTKIDECDEQIIELIRRRFELVREIGRYKTNHNLPVLDTKREESILKKASKYSHSPEIDGIYRTIMEKSKSLQRK